MYEDNENKIDWKNILKKILLVVVAIIVVLGIVTLITKCTKNTDKNEVPTEVDLTKALDELEEATLKYLTKDNLPTVVNASKTIRLKILTNKGLVTSISDSEGNRCDTSESYAEVTKLDNNYAVKLSLTCGKNSDYRIIYVGCFEECNGGVCKGTEGKLNGTCGDETTNNPSNTNNNTNSNTTTNSNNSGSSTTNNKPSTNNNKPTTNTNTNSNTKPNTNTNTNTNTNNNTNNNTSNNTIGYSYVTQYEYTKCSSATTCARGSYDERLGQCVSSSLKVLEGTVVTNTSGSSTREVILGNATMVGGSSSSSTTNAKYEGVISTTKPATIKNTNKIGYLFKNYSSSKYFYYKYSCSSGTIKNVNGTYKCVTSTSSSKTPSCSKGTPKLIGGVYKCVGTETVSGTTTKSCQDRSYFYNANTGRCTKEYYEYSYSDPEPGVCRTTWSASTSLAGWTRTGRTQTIRE